MKVACDLRSNSAWYIGEPEDATGNVVGCIRFVQGISSGTLTSNFRRAGDTNWSPSVVAQRGGVDGGDNSLGFCSGHFNSCAGGDSFLEVGWQGPQPAALPRTKFVQPAAQWVSDLMPTESIEGDECQNPWVQHIPVCHPMLSLEIEEDLLTGWEVAMQALRLPMAAGATHRGTASAVGGMTTTVNSTAADGGPTAIVVPDSTASGAAAGE